MAWMGRLELSLALVFVRVDHSIGVGRRVGNLKVNYMVL